MASGMGLNKTTEDTNQKSTAIAPNNTETTSKSIDTITIIKPDGSKIENVENTAENIAKAKEDAFNKYSFKSSTPIICQR